MLARSGGNPLYLEELARAVGEGDDAAALPGSLRLTVLARAARLEPTVRQVLDLAAVSGSPFLPEILEAVLSQTGDADALSPALHTLLEHDFLLPVERGYVFRHPLLEEAIYASLPTPHRQTWHRRLADALAERHEASPR